MYINNNNVNKKLITYATLIQIKKSILSLLAFFYAIELRK